jgi:hypothetical protein
MASKSSDNSVEIAVAGPATTMSLFETTLDADDSSSTRYGGSTVDRTTGTSRGGSDQHHQHLCDDDDDIAKKETQLVMQQRLFVGTLLLVAGVAISLVVYLTTSRSEHREFRAFFSGGADKILSTFNDIVREKVSVVCVVCGSVCVLLIMKSGILVDVCFGACVFFGGRGLLRDCVSERASCLFDVWA